MAKILLEVEIDTQGGVEALAGLKEAVSGVGGVVTKTSDVLSKQEKEYQRLIDRLEPARVAAERFANQQALLESQFKAGNQTQQEYASRLATLKQNFEKAGTAGGGMFGALKQGAAELATSLAGLFALSRMVSWLANGTKEAMEQERALSQLSNIVKQFGEDGAAAAAGAEKLAASLQRIGIDDSESLKAVRDLTIQTHDYETALSASSLAADMAARTGKSYGEALNMVQDLIAGKTRALIQANKDYGTGATTLQGALDALEKQNRGYGASLDDNLQKTQSAMAQFNDFAKMLGGPLSDAAAFAIKVLKGLGATASAAVLVLLQAGNGLVALGQAVYTMFKNLDLSSPLATIKSLGSLDFDGAKAVMAGWVTESKGQWQGWEESVEQQFSGVQASTEKYKRIVSDTSRTVAKASSDLKAQIKANDKLISDMVAAASGRGDMLGSSGSFQAAVFASDLSSAFTLGGLGDKAADQFLKDFSTGFGLHSTQYLDPLARDAGKRWGVTMGSAAGDDIQQGIEAGILGGLAGSVKFTDKAAGDLSKQFGKAFSDGFMKVFEGGSFQDAWASVSNGMAGIFSRSLGNMVSAALTGVDSQGNKVEGVTGILGAGGLWDKTANNGKGGFNWQGAAGMAGGMISSYAQQGGDRTMGAVGGMVSGASAGMAFGPWGAIIGAIIGGLMGYFGTPVAKSVGYTYGVDANGAQVKYSGVGPGYPEQAEQQRQLTDKYNSTVASFHDILVLLKQPLYNPAGNLGFNGSTKDANSLFSMILKNDLPRAIFESFNPFISTGLTGIGVSEGRAGQLLAQFSAGNYDAALTALKAYIEALTRLQTLHTDLAKSFDELKTELMQDTMAAWKESADKTVTQIGELSKSLDMLSSDEQVARAGQIADLAEQQYQNNLAYLQQILQAQKNVDDSFKSMFLTWDEQKAVAGGADKAGQWYVSQLGQAQQQLAGATSPEQVTAIVAQMQQWMNALHNLNWQGDIGGGGSQTWVEEFAKTTQTLADSMYKSFADNVIAQNKVLSDAVAAIQIAMLAETTANGELTDALNGATGSVGGFGGALEKASDVLNEFVGTVSAGNFALRHA